MSSQDPAARDHIDVLTTTLSIRRVGNYVLQQRIGIGGMGEVFLARHSEFMHRQYAVKLIRAERLSERLQQRFRQEIAAMGVLSHRNLVFATDAGNQDGCLYLVMEYVNGVDLQAWLDARGPLREGQVAEIVRQVCLGLGHAHSHGVIHRDIKPSNVMISADPRVKLLDLGVASLQGEASRVTKGGELIGTAAFMAPELWRTAAAATPQSDIYAVGCTAYALLAGTPPFDWAANRSLFDLLAAHQEEIPAPLHDLIPGISPEVSRVIQQALEKSPERRFATAAALAAALEPFAEPLDHYEIPAATTSAALDDTGMEVPRRGRTPDVVPPDDPLRWTRNFDRPRPLYWRIFLAAGLLMVCSSLTLTLAYYGPFSSETWRLRFDQLGQADRTPGLGFAIELLRGWLCISLTCFILGTQFTSEIRSFFNIRLHNRIVWLTRLLTLAVVATFVILETSRQLSLDQAPAKLAQWGLDQGLRTDAAVEAHPYRCYLIYSLINYVVVVGGLFAFPFFRFFASDFPYIRHQLVLFIRRQKDPEHTGRRVTNLHRFGAELRELACRYTAVIGGLSVGAHYDYWLGNLTLTEEGQQTLMLGTLTVGLAVGFVLIIAWIYSQGFEVTSRHIAATGTVTDEHLLSQVTTLWFLRTTLIYRIGGLACLSLIFLFANALLG